VKRQQPWRGPDEHSQECPLDAVRSRACGLAGGERVEAPCLFDGPINGERFLAYVEQFLVPALKPDDIVLADNLGSHKSKAVRRAIKAVGARILFLPKYSPDLNPIEQVFAKLKAFVRKAAPRTFDAVSDAQTPSPSSPQANAPTISPPLAMPTPKCRTL
jgi:transposase